MLSERHVISEDTFVEIIVWRLPSMVEGSEHGFKYRLALIGKGQCVLRYDNERGQGDHKHVGGDKIPYSFTTPQALLDEFWKEADNWRS